MAEGTWEEEGERKAKGVDGRERGGGEGLKRVGVGREGRRERGKAKEEWRRIRISREGGREGWIGKVKLRDR